MTIRIVSNEQIRFDVDIESYNRIVRDITRTTTDLCERQINAIIAGQISNELRDAVVASIDIDAVCYHVSNNLNYARIIDLAKTQLVSALLDDERFKVLVNRGINNSTIGFIDETVERVTAHMEQQAGIESDI